VNPRGSSFAVGWGVYFAILFLPVWLIRLVNFWELVRIGAIFLSLIILLICHRKWVWAADCHDDGQQNEESSVDWLLPVYAILFLGFIVAQFYFAAVFSHGNFERSVVYIGILPVLLTLLGVISLWTIAQNQGTNRWIVELSQRCDLSVRVIEVVSAGCLIISLITLWLVLPGVGSEIDAPFFPGVVLTYGIFSLSVVNHAPVLFCRGRPFSLLSALPLIGVIALGITTFIGIVEVGGVFLAKQEAAILYKQGQIESSARRYYEAEMANWVGLELAPIATYDSISQTLKSEIGHYSLAAFFTKRVISKVGSQFAPDNQFLSEKYVDLGDILVKMGRGVEAREAFTKSYHLGKNPLDILQYISRYDSRIISDIWEGSPSISVVDFEGKKDTRFYPWIAMEGRKIVQNDRIYLKGQNVQRIHIIYEEGSLPYDYWVADTDIALSDDLTWGVKVSAKMAENGCGSLALLLEVNLGYTTGAFASVPVELEEDWKEIIYEDFYRSLVGTGLLHPEEKNLKITKIGINTFGKSCDCLVDDFKLFVELY
jgi:hypothetical protein